MATRTIKFTSDKLGNELTLMLCFMPPSSELFVTQFPIAWKVTTLAADASSDFRVTWTSTLGVCAAELPDKLPAIARAYVPIRTGQTTSLRYNPPNYFWTAPRNKVGQPTAQAVNMTGGRVHIGQGFMADEKYNMALVCKDVEHKEDVDGNFAPILKAYVAVDGINYQQGELIREDMRGAKPIWEADLRKLGRRQPTVISIYKDADGEFKAKEVINAAADAFRAEAIPPPLPIPCVSRHYRATLAFETYQQVQDSLADICKHLSAKGYRVKVIVKSRDSDARLDLVLPDLTSCNQAEKEILGYIEGHGFGARVAIRERAGSLMFYSQGPMLAGSDINPAGYEWYDSTPIPAGVVNQKIADVLTVAGELAGDNNNMNGTANGTDGVTVTNGVADVESGLAQPQAQAPVSYGKTRTIGRKASVMSLFP
ncbi:hypothetical protein C8Q76DRAFT_757431 [Earliella scabrosa]|nr:hypothetical protein C8Q76DRAFT_757431 [Earliella scabrosa]